MSTDLALGIGLGSTLFMTGLIWFVQVVHYPLFDRVDPSAFRRYHAEHTRRTTYVVLAPMVLELASAVVLVMRPPTGSGPDWAWAGLVAAGVSWLATLGLSVPLHQRLALGFDPKAHCSLVRTNLVRLIGWTAHSAILMVMAARQLHQRQG